MNTPDYKRHAASYDLAKKVPDMRSRGLRIETSYGEIEIVAEEGGAVIDLIEAILRRRAVCEYVPKGLPQVAVVDAAQATADANAGLSEFEQKAVRLKLQLQVVQDKQVAEALGLTQSAWNQRKRRGVFPEKDLYVLVAKRPELGLDVDYVLTGVGLGKPAMSNKQVAQVFSEIFGAGVSK